ncbi:MAG: hypothetical protein IKW33_00145 [Clostridia bacterium]|nr:hypothetical protein [Clostridia bacterium]
MKKILPIISLILCGITVIFTFTFGIYHLSKDKENISKEYKCIITLWHVDTFEGGTGSRKQFLQNQAKNFEKKNKGVFIMVTSYNIEGVKEQLAKGNYPDILSYGNGIDVKNLSEINSNLSFSASEINNKKYAFPWCRGGYVLIKNKNLKSEKYKNITISKGQYSQPLLALFLELEQGELHKEFSNDFSNYEINVLSPTKAYSNFVIGKTKYLLGTQRDVYKLLARGIDFESIPLTQFNDLYQYVSTTTLNVEKKFYADAFINFLLQEKEQKKLSQISMFSNYFSVDYENNTLKNMQLTKNSFTISPFISQGELTKLESLSLNAIKGNKEEINKIKNLLFCLEKY